MSNTSNGAIMQRALKENPLTSEDPLAQDPLILSNQEINKNKRSILIIIGGRQPVGDVSIRNENGLLNQNHNSGNKENLPYGGNIIIPSANHKYSCHICDDVCADELEFKQHLDFHSELDINIDTNAEVVASTTTPLAVENSRGAVKRRVRKPAVIDMSSSSSELSNSASSDSLYSPSGESSDSEFEENTNFDIVLSSDGEPSTQSSKPVSEENRNFSIVLSNDGEPSAESSNSKSNENPNSGIALPRSGALTAELTNSVSEENRSFSMVLPRSGAPTAESSSSVSKDNRNFSIALSSNGAMTKTITTVQHGADKSHSKSETNKSENYKLPDKPVTKCDCRLKQLSTECEFCTEPPKYVCGNCKTEFKSFTELTIHYKEAHKSARYFCQDCGHGYTRKQFWQNCTDRHKGLLACYQCTFSSKTKEELEQHLVTHRSKCPKCEKVCNTIADRELHMLEVHKGVTYTCKECNLKFYKYSGLRSHNIRHHRTGEYTCKICEKVYTNLGAYNRHKYSHLQKQVICEECGNVFSSRKRYKSHQKTVHTKADKDVAETKKVYVCDVCKKEFATPTAKVNCQNRHGGIKRYKCNICDNAYFYSGSLIVHKRIHTGEKPYICFICSRRFYASQILLKHCLSHGISEKSIKKRLKGTYQPVKKE